MRSLKNEVSLHRYFSSCFYFMITSVSKVWGGGWREPEERLNSSLSLQSFLIPRAIIGSDKKETKIQMNRQSPRMWLLYIAPIGMYRVSCHFPFLPRSLWRFHRPKLKKQNKKTCSHYCGSLVRVWIFTWPCLGWGLWRCQATVNSISLDNRKTD